MSEVVVGFNVRAYAHIDTERGIVNRVVVNDEDADYAGAEVVEGSEQEAVRALEIFADEQEEWPAWRFG
jgi:hypothetical protein